MAIASSHFSVKYWNPAQDSILKICRSVKQFPTYRSFPEIPPCTFENLNSCFRRNGCFSNSGIGAVTGEATSLTGEIQIGCPLEIIIGSSDQRFVWVGASRERGGARRPTDSWITGAAIARRTNWIADGHYVIASHSADWMQLLILSAEKPKES
jgi:hypothetical protein